MKGLRCVLNGSDEDYPERGGGGGERFEVCFNWFRLELTRRDLKV